MSKDTAAAPSLPPASVDFNKLHDQMKAGKDPAEAVKAAVVAETVARPFGEPAEVPPADHAVDALEPMTKPQLQERARDLGIAFETDANKERLKELIRAHPDGVSGPEVNEDVITNDRPAAA